MEMLWHYVLDGNMTNQNSGYSMWGFAKMNGRNYFVKQFLSPKYPAADNVSSPERLQKRKALCEKFVQQKRAIYQAVNANSDGNDVRICELFRVGSKYYISMEKIDALPWDIDKIAQLPEAETRRLCAIIAHGIAALHKGRLIHADIKHDNILFTHAPNGRLTAKIIDFDSAFLETDPPTDEEEIIGDWVYFSPEVWQRMERQMPALTCKMDVFALGVLFHQYFCGQLPGFDSRECSTVGQAVQKGIPLRLSEKLPPDVAELLGEMLQADPEKRPAASEVFERLCPATPEPITPPPPAPAPPRKDFFRQAGNL